MLPESRSADVCLFLEGAYPYVRGGVSSWTHDLIRMQDHLSFSIVSLVSADATCECLYQLPPNVVDFRTIRLQRLPAGIASLGAREDEALFETLEVGLLRLQSVAELGDLEGVIDILEPYRNKLGRRLLLDSVGAWDLLLRMYRKTMPKVSFLDYFWSWRSLFGGLYSVLLMELPVAKTYHAFCTGYGGLLLARARLQTGRPCFLTEHGIYNNERRIEIAGADWLDDPRHFDLSVARSSARRDLKDFWMDTFGNYARLCYQACTAIITLYSGNQEFQRMDGAPAEKLQVIPNGIDPVLYEGLGRRPHPPTVALIGRVVPIKDIKTYIKAVDMLRQSVPDLRALILGSEDEDPDYAMECHELADHLGLQGLLEFKGNVQLRDWFPEIDVVVLSSLSEAQPLVVLEAGAAGIPVVATDVGSCREMIMGMPQEHPSGGAGGAIVPLASPLSIAQALQNLLTHKDLYAACSAAIAGRVRRLYTREAQREAYADLYGAAIEACREEAFITPQKDKEGAWQG